MSEEIVKAAPKGTEYIIISTPEGKYNVRTQAGNNYGPFPSVPAAVEGMMLVIKPEVHYYDKDGKEMEIEVPNA